MNNLISVGQMPAVTAAADLPLRKAAAISNPLPSAAPLTGRDVVLESRTRPTEGPGATLLQHHLPSPSGPPVARAGLQTPARYERAPASATWPVTARASQRGAAPGQPGLRPGGENATDGVTGSQSWTSTCEQTEGTPA